MKIGLIKCLWKSFKKNLLKQNKFMISVSNFLSAKEYLIMIKKNTQKFLLDRILKNL